MYVPILSIRPSEITAITELPDLAKDQMLPHILVKHWRGQGDLSRGIDKVLYGLADRPWLMELDPEYKPTRNSNGYEEIANLRNPKRGFINWFNFVIAHAPGLPVFLGLPRLF